MSRYMVLEEQENNDGLYRHSEYPTNGFFSSLPRLYFFGDRVLQLLD